MFSLRVLPFPHHLAAVAEILIIDEKWFSDDADASREAEALDRAVKEWGIDPEAVYKRAFEDLIKVDKNKRAFVRIVEDGEEMWKQRRLMTKDDWLRVFNYRILPRIEHAVRQRQQSMNRINSTESPFNCDDQI